MDVRDSLALIDMDKGVETLGPLFEAPSRRLQDDPRFRADWTQYQALRALAWEAAPELDDRLLRQALQASRRQEVERKLARATGSQDAARELLLEPQRNARSGLPVWAAFLLLAGALGLGWLAFNPAGPAPSDAPPVPTAAGTPPGGDLTFEFPVSNSPAQAALDSTQPAPHDETHSDDASNRQARRLVNQNLRDAAQTRPRATPTERPEPTQVPTATALPTVAATAVPPTLVPAVAASQATNQDAGASFILSSERFPASATITLPESGSVDLRLFDMRGRLVHRYLDGNHAAGTWQVDLPATDEENRSLPQGSYYLRVITRWFSKVEALDQP
jgi:FlgD Ig-like domain